MKSPSASRARITCVLPGLVWPQALPGQVFAANELPGLRALLGRHEALSSPARPLANWLAGQFGATTLPVAALRRLGEEDAPDIPPADDGRWLCADPISLNFMRDAFLATGPDALEIRGDEARALVAALNEQLGDIGRFEASAPDRWYLHLPAPAAARFCALDDVVGRPVALFPPEGERARDWARIGNEAQVILHNHPANQARLEGGHPALNALWFWGEGDTTPTLTAPADTLVGNDPLLRGLARRSRALWLDEATARSPAHGKHGHTWWLDDRLHRAVLARDLGAWAAGLRALDAELLQPLWQSLRDGRIDTLDLAAPSERCLLEVRATRAPAWQFWHNFRQPLTVAALTQILQNP
ncbi:hypothetical protein [Uliginosibacterium sp. H1]|uniref:hypothetical protein n=1 Tax=Uliginosibacterium sp. H1 TaxID=3114757 RepID=UPI002E199912|nr:hypothetical protein [Uliginosibacterium sp. H1]